MMNDRRMGAESRGLEQRECGDEEDGVKLVEKDLVELTPGPGDWTIDARNNGVGQSESRKGKEFDKIYPLTFGVQPSRPSCRHTEVVAQTGGICSVSQIRKARDSFQSRDTIAFLKQLALMPRSDAGSVDFFKNEATILAYRRETFGEFDETNARTFGVQPSQPPCGHEVVAESGGVCSASQIREARDSFQSRDTLAFLKQLALMPRGDEGGVDFFKNEATVLAYRRETFGEFDKTYARAFGVKPAHPSRGPTDVMAETRAVCSASQIREAGDSFESRGTLAFLKQLALMPRSDEGGVDFFKNEATVLAYRREMFGEFDGTYALAFGVKPARPSRRPTEVVAQTDRAPLGGPLVIAEALGERKNSAKPKDQANKDRYLSKRRDKQSVMKIRKIGQAVSSMQSAYVDLADGNYVLQKRAKTASKEQQIPAKLEQTLAIRKDASLLSGRDATDEKVMSTEDKPDVVRFYMADSPSLASGSKAVLPSNFSDSFPVKQSCTLAQEAEATFNLRDERSPSFPAVVEEVHGREQVHNSDSGGHVLPTIGTEIHGQNSRMCLYMGAKKAKLLKNRIGELGSEESSPREKKKRKKLSRTATNTHHWQKWIANGKVGGSSNGRVTGKTVQLGLSAEEDFQLELQKEDGRTNGMLHGMQPMVAMGSVELKLRQLLGDLQALSVNPFHGMERNNLAITQGVFLKFRSTVFQKSLTLSTPAKMDTNEVHFPKSPPGRTAGSDNTFRKNIKDLQSSKPTKPLVRPDDSAKGGRKRGPSDRQEELAAKRVKKINDMKSLAAKRGGAQKAPGAGRDGNETVAFGQLKPLKPDCVKNALSPAKAAEPMMLVMRFPPKTTLPSASELKARLARFGPLDHSRTRIVWKTSTCQVVFVYKVDAEAAHRHLTGNNTLFSKLNVRCHIWPLEAAKTLVLESKFRREHAPTETLHSRDSAALLPLQHPSAQLKSHLKKTPGDGAGTTMVDNGGRNTFNNASFADSGAYSSCHGMGLDGRNQKVVSPSPLPILPPLPPVSTPQFLNAQNSMCFAAAASRNIHNFSTKTNLDIAPEMLSLLTKCNDIVTYLRTYLGYAPYRPL